MEYPNPWDLVIGLQVEDADAVELSIRYLEADPWEFRSGYLKGRLLHHLANRALDDAQRVRLRSVLVNYCDVGFRFEFLDACRLARRQSIPGLRDELASRLLGSDTAIATRSLRMLLATRRPLLAERERQRARAVLLAWAGDVRLQQFDSRWVARTVERLWPADPVGDLTAIAASGDRAERRAAELLLRALRRHRWRRSSRHGTSAMP